MLHLKNRIGSLYSTLIMPSDLGGCNLSGIRFHAKLIDSHDCINNHKNRLDMTHTLHLATLRQMPQVPKTTAETIKIKYLFNLTNKQLAKINFNLICT